MTVLKWDRYCPDRMKLWLYKISMNSISHQHYLVESKEQLIKNFAIILKKKVQTYFHPLSARDTFRNIHENLQGKYLFQYSE